MSNKPSLKEKEQPLTDPGGRRALVTANGIILGFFLSFAVDWFNNPEEWEKRDLLFGAPAILALILLLVALGTSLLPYRQTENQYKLSAILLLSGLVVAFLAVFLSELT